MKKDITLLEMTVSEYMDRYKINRHSVHRRIKKYEDQDVKKPVNNIMGIRRHGKKMIIILVNSSIKFSKKK